MTAAVKWLWRSAWLWALADSAGALAFYLALNWLTGAHPTTAGFALMIALGALVEAKRARKDPTP